MKKKKVLFYTETKWAYGIIHNDLSKELYKHNIIADSLNWDLNYTQDEFNFFIKTYDVFVTSAPLVPKLHQHYKVPLHKIIATAHEQWDLYLANRDCGIEFFEVIKDFAVISNILVDLSKNLGIKRVPKVVNAGICFDNFYRPVSDNLKNVGYGGAKVSPNFFGIDRKRGQLVEKALEGIQNVGLISHSFYHYLCMPAYYETMDCLIMSSLEEAGGMPILEAAAAGRLVIGTPVGYFEDHGPKGGGIVVPLDENDFVNKTKEALIFYRDNPTIYKIKCEQIQQYARDNYDWSKKIQNWVELLDS